MAFLAKSISGLAALALGAACRYSAALLASVGVLLGASGAHAAKPEPWQMDLQPPAGSIAEMATDLHNLLLVVITLISLFVLGLLCMSEFACASATQPVKDVAQHSH